MARKPVPTLREQEVRGLKYLDRVLPLLRRLREVGCARDKAGNRDLHMDEYCALILLFLFSPAVYSLRTIQRASELRKVQRLLGCGRASLGSLSEAVQVFEPKRLEEIIAELGAELTPHAVTNVWPKCATRSPSSMARSYRLCRESPRRCGSRPVPALGITPGGCTPTSRWTCTFPCGWT